MDDSQKLVGYVFRTTMYHANMFCTTEVKKKYVGKKNRCLVLVLLLPALPRPLQEQHARAPQTAQPSEEQQRLEGLRLSMQLGVHRKVDPPAGPAPADLGLWEAPVLTRTPGGAGGHLKATDRRRGLLPPPSQI